MTDTRRNELHPSYDVVDFADLGADITTCDREPIHLSGAIQPWGVLVAASEDDLTIRQVSANTERHFGIDPYVVLGAPLHRMLGVDAVERLRRALGDPRASGSDPIVFQGTNGSPYEMTWHRMDRQIVVEIEAVDVIAAASMSMSMLFADFRHTMQVLEGAESLQALCDLAAEEIRHVTGYDRVMVYRFHPDWHGEVVAEARDDRLTPFVGLNYPASDIPRQARKMYLLNHLRVIADVDYEPVPLLGVSSAGNDPLNLSLSGLRSVSPFHLAYLRNMGVRATLTISLMRGTRLWGMLACHHGSPKRVDAQLRSACRVLGQVFSLQMVSQENKERDAHRSRLAEIELKLLTRMSGAESLADALAASDPSPLELTAADGMVARIDGEIVSAGAVPPFEAVDALLARLCTDDEPSSLVCDDLPLRFVELEPYAARAAGVLAVPLSAGYEDFVLWFRGELVQNMSWAGNPDKAMVGDPTAPAGSPEAVGLSPRSSFDAWAEEVRGQCRPWLAAEIDAAKALADAVPDFQLARARDRLAHLADVSYLAMHDPLTGLPNRALLLERSAEALDRQVYDGRHVALLFIDLDRFKLVNDSLGHAAGDDLLRQAAQRIVSCVRAGDTVARIGGDEFIVLSEGITVLQADQLADRIVQAFRAPFVLDGHEAVVTSSIGVAIAGPNGTPAQLLGDADTAMYRAKHSGRNAAAPFTYEMKTISLRRVEIETSLRPALEHGELRLSFQPIYRANGALEGFEALARWPLKGRGMVPPSEFIPVAEATGLIGPLTDWALEEGVKAIARWREKRPDLDLSVAVNIVAAQMLDGHLQRSIDSTLRRHQVPPRALCLEITEGALVTDNELSQRFLYEARRQGLRLSIDDFGTGFSSLAYLTKLPVHQVKIDRAFIAGLPASNRDVTVVASVVGLAHQLGFEVVAEGVETDEQLAAVRRLGCDLVQGYLLGRPVPPDEIDRLLSTAPGDA